MQVKFKEDLYFSTSESGVNLRSLKILTQISFNLIRINSISIHAALKKCDIRFTVKKTSKKAWQC